MSDLVAYTNSIIAKGLGLSESLDFVNDPSALYTAEKVLEEMGLNERYLEALKFLDDIPHVVGTPPKSLQYYKTRTDSLRARAIRKLIQESNEPLQA